MDGIPRPFDLHEALGVMWIEQVCTAEFGYVPALAIETNPEEGWIVVQVRPPKSMIPEFEEKVREDHYRRYAIWRHTGSIHEYDPEYPGAVKDDPILKRERRTTVLPFHSIPEVPR